MNRQIVLISVAIVSILFSTVHAATLVALKCRDGIVLATDSLSTPSPQLIGSRVARRIFLLQQSTAVCNAAEGAGAGQFNQLYSALRDTSGEHELLFDSQLTIYSIAFAARLNNGNVHHLLIRDLLTAMFSCQ